MQCNVQEFIDKLTPQPKQKRLNSSVALDLTAQLLQTAPQLQQLLRKLTKYLRDALRSTEARHLKEAALTAPLPPATCGRRRGRLSIHQKHPLLIPTVNEFLEQNDSQADSRRRTTEMVTGVRMREIVDHVEKELQLSVGRTTLRHLGNPAHEGGRQARRYKKEVPFKLAHKRNNKRLDVTGNSQHACAEIALARELMARNSEETVSLSCDSMNKLKVGTLAVSRYHQIKQFFLKMYEPCYNDHDFPNPG